VKLDQQKRIMAFRGQLAWHEDLEVMRQDRSAAADAEP